MPANPFEALGLHAGATAEEIRASYRKLVKQCHPDQFTDPERQKAAQQELIRLNLAYEEALRLSAQANVGYNQISAEEAKHFASRLLEQEKPESALRQLMRAESKDADWYFLQGQILMKMKQYETAHQSYREAVRRDPENRAYRSGALDAALAMKKARPFAEKLQSFIKERIGRR